VSITLITSKKNLSCHRAV